MWSPQGVLVRRVLLAPVVLLVHVVLRETQVVLVLLDHLVFLVVLAARESALKEAKEKLDSLEYKDPKVMRHIE